MAASCCLRCVYRRFQAAFSAPFFFFLLALVLPPTRIDAKTVSGDFQLSGVNSEAVLTSFAISPYGRGWMGITLSSKEMYETEQSLKIHLFQDTQWSAFQKALLCTDRKKLAIETLNVEFHHSEHEEESYQWMANFGMALDQHTEPRTHYWYVVVDDCSLEQVYRDSSIPKLHYKVQLWNDVGGNVMHELSGSSEREAEKNVQLTHLSADEVGLSSIHAATLVVSVLITALMGLYIVKLLFKSGTVHAALFLVMSAGICDALSAICELIHLKAYARDGVGFYSLDALSSHFEAMCDSLVALLLLSIASGWTLPSDAIHVPQGGGSFVSKLVQGMRSPAGALVSPSPAGYLAVLIFASHGILAQWGRTFDDDFDAYHQLEHTPGRILMIFRMVLGVLLLIATAQTRMACPTSLQPFYSKLAIVGLCWFFSLPLVTWTCSWAVPYYMRHPAVATWGAIAQSTALVLLAWLFTAHSGASSFHKVSRLQAKNGDGLTDSLATSNSSVTPTSWSFGKAKIRLD